ncbi:MAG: stage II sporulation protein R [Acutalibacteraceae bacterium]
MKLMFKALCCGLCIACLLSMVGFCGACEDIESEVLRLHILANSDSDEDQALKLKVRDGLLTYSETLFKNTATKAEAKTIAKENLAQIQSEAEKIIRENGYDYSVQVYIKNISFNTRVYDNITLPAGNYDTIQVVIGAGEGHNWWCVMFPPLCLPSATGTELNTVLNDEEQKIVTDDNYTFKFKIVEIFEGIVSLFR